jgi:hypothetical protein
MSKNRTFTIFVLIVALAHVGCHVCAASFILTHPVPLFQRKSKLVATRAAWALSSVVDIMLALGIVWQLRKFEVVFTATKTFMYKLVILTVVSGSLTTITGLVYIVLLQRSKYGHLVIAVNAAKFYGITVFANLALTEGTRPRSMFIGPSKMTAVHKLGGLMSSVIPASFGSSPKTDDSPSHPSTAVADGSPPGYSTTTTKNI